MFSYIDQEQQQKKTWITKIRNQKVVITTELNKIEGL